MQKARLRNIVNKSKMISAQQQLDPFDLFKNSLPPTLDSYKDGGKYRLKAAWKAYGEPRNYQEALWNGLVETLDGKNFIMPSIGYNEDTDSYEYLNVGKDNEIVNKDIRAWDNDVIPFIKELKLGGYIRTFDEELNCWMYSKNDAQRMQVGGKFKNGQRCDTEDCAKFSNDELRGEGYLISGNAWNLKGPTVLYSGYNILNYPSYYDRRKVEEYNNEAADNFLKNFDSNSLDKDSIYAVNMYYNGSHAQEQAYKEGRNKMTGTHTGFVAWNPDNNRWEVTHNIYGTIHVDPFTKILGRGKKYGITGIFNLRKNNAINYLASILGFGEGGQINVDHNEAPKKTPEDNHNESSKTVRTPKSDVLELLNIIKNSNANFAKRLMDPNRKYITFPDGSIGNLKLSYTTADDKVLVYPEIQEINGRLVDLSNDRDFAWKSALRNKDYVVFPSEADADWFTADNYKAYFPGFELYAPQYKNGGQMNVIPDGALHARKNGMELAKEGEVTHKGIPVVDNDGNLQAEIEKEEWVMSKALTEDVESWYKKFYDEDTTQKEKDELALKCGKRMVTELLHNTDDRTGLIEKMEEEL